MMTSIQKYTGTRSCPTTETVKAAIAITSEAVSQLAAMDLSAHLPKDFATIFNRAILYLLWHQFYAVGTRAICSPYIPLRDVSPVSGIATLTDKDSGTGHKTRLVWLPGQVLEHMLRTEEQAKAVRATLGLECTENSPAVFFLDAELHEIEITPTAISEIVSAFFPFPVNTPRRWTRLSLCAAGFPNEMTDAFMGHWRERQEPWGKFSSFSYRTYLDRLKTVVPSQLETLGFAVPPKRRKRG